MKVGKRWFWILLGWVLLGPLWSYGQYPGYTAARDLVQIQNNFSVATGAINSIRSNFTQEKSLSLLAEKINSAGRFWFKRNDKIRLEYLTPFRYLVVLNQGQALIRDDQKETRIPAQAGKALRQVNNLLADVMQGKILKNNDFAARVFESEKSYLIELSPKSKALGGIYQSINIHIDRKDFTVSTMEMLERNGDRTVMKFLQKELNVDLSEDLFAVH